MLQRILLIFFVLTVAIVGGAGSVAYMLKAPEGIGAMTIGGWTAYPDIGTADADPYSKARVAREGVLSLGRAEGLAFVADRDSTGGKLRRDCDYLVQGVTPPARFWTLFAADAQLGALDTAEPQPPAVQSRMIVRQPDNSFVVALGAHPVSGNWIPIRGAGPMTLLLTLYDTPIGGSSAMEEIDLPKIVRMTCDG